MKFSKQLASTIWSVAIILCVLLSIFSLFFSACSKTADPSGNDYTITTEKPGTPKGTEVKDAD